MSDAKSKVDALKNGRAVFIFSRTTCPHCDHSKTVLGAKQKEYEAKGTPFSMGIYELSPTSADDEAMLDYLGQLTKRRTVPRIFFAGEPLGGDTDLKNSMEPGALMTLDEWLNKAVEYTTAQAT